MENRTGARQYGYCFLCLRDGTLDEVITTSRRRPDGTPGWRCRKCGGVSVKPHKVCPAHGVTCRMHLPLDE